MLFVCLSRPVCAYLCVGMFRLPSVYLTCLGIWNPCHSPLCLALTVTARVGYSASSPVSCSLFLLFFSFEQIKTLFNPSVGLRGVHTHIQSSNMCTRVTFRWLQGIETERWCMLSFETPWLIGAGPRPLSVCECMRVCDVHLFVLMGLYCVTFLKIRPGCRSFSLENC